MEGDPNIGYGHMIVRYILTDKDGKRMDLTARLTDAYRKVNGKWLVVHEHASWPVEFPSGKADWRRADMNRDLLGVTLPNETHTEESFRYLTEGDWQLLMEKARRAEFAREEVIIEEGVSIRSIFFVTRGAVRIERRRAGRPEVLIRLGPGQVFGEIEFIDALGAAASNGDGDNRR